MEKCACKFTLLRRIKQRWIRSKAAQLKKKKKKKKERKRRAAAAALREFLTGRKQKKKLYKSQHFLTLAHQSSSSSSDDTTHLLALISPFWYNSNNHDNLKKKEKVCTYRPRRNEKFPCEADAPGSWAVWQLRSGGLQRCCTCSQRVPQSRGRNIKHTFSPSSLNHTVNPLQMSCSPRCACSPADFHVSAAAQVWTCEGRMQWSGQHGVDVVQIELYPHPKSNIHRWVKCIHPVGQLGGFAGKLNNETQWCVILDSVFKWPKMVYPHLVLGATVC